MTENPEDFNNLLDVALETFNEQIDTLKTNIKDCKCEGDVCKNVNKGRLIIDMGLVCVIKDIKKQIYNVNNVMWVKLHISDLVQYIASVNLDKDNVKVILDECQESMDFLNIFENSVAK